jgi:hypothetical protein
MKMKTLGTPRFANGRRNRGPPAVGGCIDSLETERGNALEGQRTRREQRAVKALEGERKSPASPQKAPDRHPPFSPKEILRCKVEETHASPRSSVKRGPLRAILGDRVRKCAYLTYFFPGQISSCGIVL